MGNVPVDPDLTHISDTVSGFPSMAFQIDFACQHSPAALHHPSHRVAISPGLLRMVATYAFCPSIIVNGAAFRFQRCFCLDDELHSSSTFPLLFFLKLA